MIRRPYRHQRARSHSTPSSQPLLAAAGATLSISANKLRLTFGVPVVVSGIPVSITRQAAGAGALLPATSVTVVSPTVVDVGYAANLVATDVVTIPSNVPEIRAQNGGQVAAATKTF